MHASTSKDVSPRPLMYENAFEYINGLKKLINTINQIENCNLIIRYRDSYELDISTLKNIFKKNKNVIIKNKGSFLNDLNESDLLISYSSTTIEEALNLRKPVGIYGGIDHYCHIEGSPTPPINVKRYPIYNFSDQNLLSMIENIKKFHFNKPLTTNESKDFIWTKNVISHKEFLNNLFI